MRPMRTSLGVFYCTCAVLNQIYIYGVLDCGLGLRLVTRTTKKTLTAWSYGFEGGSRAAADFTFLQETVNQS